MKAGITTHSTSGRHIARAAWGGGQLCSSMQRPPKGCSALVWAQVSCPLRFLPSGPVQPSPAWLLIASGPQPMAAWTLWTVCPLPCNSLLWHGLKTLSRCYGSNWWVLGPFSILGLAGVVHSFAITVPCTGCSAPHALLRTAFSVHALVDGVFWGGVRSGNHGANGI